MLRGGVLGKLAVAEPARLWGELRAGRGRFPGDHRLLKIDVRAGSVEDEMRTPCLGGAS